MKCLTFIISLLIISTVNAQDYALALVDSSLFQNAKAIIRKQQTVFDVHSPGTATLYSTYAITILNASAKNYAKTTISYSGKSLRSVRGSVYDANGKKVKDLKKNEIEDYSASGNGTFHTDARYKVIDLSLPRYPYTIEVEYIKDYNGLLFYPTYRPQPTPSVSVENSAFIIKMPRSQTFRHQGVNFPSKPEITEINGKTRYHWHVSHINAFDLESYSPYSTKILSTLYVGPTDFVMGGHSGQMNTWEDLSSWYYELNKNRDILPPETIASIKEATKDIAETTDQIKRVYEYMQSKTRYVGVQLGIGGWQTLEAMHVNEYGWGDCKALTNYTKALLSAIGIPSHEALVYAGSNTPDIFTDFPSSQFNHVILFVPNKSDTVWLECTSQIAPFDYLGDFTDDRHVLIVKEKGGKLVKTPNFTSEDNSQITTAHVELTENNEGKARVTRQYKGQQYENNNLHYLLAESDDEISKKLYNIIDIPSFKIDSFAFNNMKERQPELVMDLSLSLNNYGNISGKRFILPLNLMNKNESIPKPLETRVFPVVLRYSYTDIDTIYYTMPEGIHVEFMPDETVIKSVFGEYKSSVRVDENNRVTYIRKIRIEKGTYPAESYNELREFYKDIVKADQIKVVFLRKT